MKKITKLLTTIGAASLAALSLSLGLCFVGFSPVQADALEEPAKVESKIATTASSESILYVVWNVDNKKEYVYNGQIQHPEAAFYRIDGDGNSIPVEATFVYTGNDEQRIANADGAYSRIGVELRDTRYVLADDAVTSIEFRIKRAKIALPQLTNNSFEFKNDLYDISQYIGYDAETLEYLVSVRNGTAKDVPSSGTITSQVELRDPVNSVWEDGTTTPKQIVWTITAKVITVPTFTETLVYSGELYKVAEHLNDFDPAVTVYGNEVEATNAGIYRANLRLPTENGGKNYVWATKDFNGTVEWMVQKAELTFEWDKWCCLYNGSTYSPRAKIASGIVEADKSLNSQDPRLIYFGDTDRREPGSYKIEVQIGLSSELYKNYVLAKDSATFYWVIKESVDEVAVTVEWDTPESGGYTFNGEVQYPKVKALYREDSAVPENLEDYEITYIGDWNKSRYRGAYAVGVEIAAADGTPLRIRHSEENYVIRRNSAGVGDDPNEGQTTKPDDGEWYDVFWGAEFEVNGGSSVESQIYFGLKGKVTRPTDPTKNGYAFVGWYADEACLTPFDFESEVTDVVTIYAKWVKVDVDLFGCNSSISTPLIVFFGMLTAGGTAILIKKRSKNK